MIVVVDHGSEPGTVVTAFTISDLNYAKTTRRVIYARS